MNGKIVVCVVAALFLGAACGGAGGGSNPHLAAWCSSDPFGTWTTGGYTFNNDVWGPGPGPQTICANYTPNNWWVTTQQPETGGVKSYPHSEHAFDKPLSSIDRITSKFDVIVPGAGTYNTSYDIWLNHRAFEVMLWMNEVNLAPLGDYVQTVSLGGHTWKLNAGMNGTTEVYSFVSTAQATSGTVDVLAVLRWLQSGGRFGPATVQLDNVQFGWEIVSTKSVSTTFTVKDYSVST